MRHECLLVILLFSDATSAKLEERKLVYSYKKSRKAATEPFYRFIFFVAFLNIYCKTMIITLRTILLIISGFISVCNQIIRLMVTVSVKSINSDCLIT